MRFTRVLYVSHTFVAQHYFQNFVAQTVLRDKCLAVSHVVRLIFVARLCRFKCRRSTAIAQRTVTGSRTTGNIILARDSICYCYSALYAIACPSVCLSVWHASGSDKNGWS